MWKIAGVLILLSLALNSFASRNLSHLEKLKSRYPYGLIGDDYGLLTEEDLAVNTCDSLNLTPFSPGKNMAYSYWQCFSVKGTKMECDHADFDPSSKKETAYLEINAQNENGLQSYLARDAREMQECQQYLSMWKRNTSGEQYVCISGSYGGFSGIRDGSRETDWVFDKFKTRKGCISKGVECSLKEVTSLEHCLLPSNWRAH